MARPLAWADTLLAVSITAASGMSALDLLADLAAADVKTVMRLVGHLTVTSVAEGTTASAVQGIDLAIGVAAKEAFDGAVLPDANVSSDVPARGWLWRDRMTCLRYNGSGTVEDWHYPEVRFDIRSGRKVDRGVLFLTAFNSNLVGGTPFTILLSGIVRALCAT